MQGSFWPSLKRYLNTTVLAAGCPRRGPFTPDFYSRDGARAIMSLLSYGEVEKAERAVRFAHEWMMYYPRQRA